MAELINRTKIFISWHNDAINNSKLVAREFKLFIKALFELDVDVFFSGDMESGKWRVTLDNGFVDCTYAVFILQGNAVDTNWINAEYGAFVMKSLLNNDKACSKLIAFKFPDDKEVVSKSKAPIKDLQVYELSPNPEQGILVYFGRLLYELKNGFVPGALTDDDYIKLLTEEMGGVFNRYWGIFIRNIGLLKLYGKDYKREEYASVASNAVESDSFGLPYLFFDCSTDYIPRESIVDDVKKRLDNNQFVNLVGMGGCGKTTITYNFYNKYKDDYALVTGKVINGDFYMEFDEDLASKLNIRYAFAKDGNLDYKATFCKIVEKLMEYKRIEARKYNLFILDVNEDSDYVQISEAINELKKLKDWRFLVASREKIDAFEKTQIDLCKIAQNEKDVDFLKQVFFHYIKERKDFYKERISDDQLSELFKKFGYLPLLVEQLAYYLDEVIKAPTFDELIKWLGDDIVHSDMVEEEAKGSEKYRIVGNFLSKLMDFSKRLNPAQKDIAKYFMMWPAEYYSPDFIQTMSGHNFGDDFGKQLNRLCDKCILDRKMDKDGCYVYKMHSLIAASFRDQVFTLDANKEYRDFTAYTSCLKKYIRGAHAELVLNCVKYSLSHFASFDVNYLLGITDDIVNKDVFFRFDKNKFDNALALNSRTITICENALKIKILRLENPEISQVDIYKKIVGELREDGNKTDPMPPVNVYFKSLHRSESELPDEQLDNLGSFINISVKGVSIKMRKVVGGSYQMGNVTDSDNKPHTVTVGDFYIGATQVTQELWDAVMKKSGFQNPSKFNECKDNPVEMVSWYDCINFILELNELTGLHFSLPTEEQWEYVAGWRNDGNRNTFSGCNDENELKKYAWFSDNSDNKTHRVGCGVLPNDFGIYDMSGNVWEWCQDKDNSSEIDCVLRGGAWDSASGLCSIWRRNIHSPIVRTLNIGFRLVLSSPKKE